MSVLKRGIKSAQRKERQMTFVLDASGPTLTVGSNQATVATAGTGDFTLTFTEPFARAPYAVITPIVSDCQAYSDASTVSTIDINVTDADGTTAADKDVLIHVIGWDAPDEI